MPDLSEIVHNTVLLVMGVAVIVFIARRFRCRPPRHIPIMAVVIVRPDIRSKWSRLSRVAKIGVCVVGGIGTLAIIAAFLAGAPVATLLLFASLVTVGVATFTALA